LILKERVKAMLYAYALLGSVSEDYEEHIRNKAILSCLKSEPADRLAEKIAWEILEKRVLETFKGKIEDVLAGLTPTERTLVAIRFFGKEKDVKARLLSPREAGGWGERKYFRSQRKLLETLCAKFERIGLTAKYFDEELVGIDVFAKVVAIMERRKQRKAQSSS
jgi:hypothetical protein